MITGKYWALLQIYFIIICSEQKIQWKFRLWFSKNQLYIKSNDETIKKINFPFNKYKNCSCTDWYIELFEDFPTDRKEQLNKREGEVIREIATLDKNIAGREYKGYQKEYFENNKDKITHTFR